jgi:hypothetical protein
MASNRPPPNCAGNLSPRETGTIKHGEDEILENPRKPGMLMKNQAIENNGVAKAHSRLDNERKQHAKMKVYPRMLMKINGLRNDLVKNRECYR